MSVNNTLGWWSIGVTPLRSEGGTVTNLGCEDLGHLPHEDGQENGHVSGHRSGQGGDDGQVTFHTMCETWCGGQARPGQARAKCKLEMDEGKLRCGMGEKPESEEARPSEARNGAKCKSNWLEASRVG